MKGRTVKASSIRGALAPWRYEATLNRWIGGRARAFREFTADLSEVAPGESVLDLGCGTGELAMTLARRVGPTGRVAGIDLSNDLIAGARRKAKRAGLAVDYRVASIERLPFADASADVVVSSLVMHHLAPEVLERAVREIQRVLKPGGRVFVIDFQSLDQAGHDLPPAHRRDHSSDQRPASRHAGTAHGHSQASHHGSHGQPHDHGHAPTHRHGPGVAHDPAHKQDHAIQLGHLHDHRPILVRLLKEAGLTDAQAVPVEFGQRLEVTRGRLTT